MDDNGLTSRILFSELYNIIANRVIFVGFLGAIAPIVSPGAAPTCTHSPASLAEPIHSAVSWSYWYWVRASVTSHYDTIITFPSKILPKFIDT